MCNLFNNYENLKEGRCKALVWTKIEEAFMWANKSVVQDK
jgi:hypothetical protein